MTRLWPEGEQAGIRGKRDEPLRVGQCFIWRGVSHRVSKVCNCWRVHTCWWEPEKLIQREYQKVITDTGILCLLYYDLIEESLLLARVYD